MMQLLAEQLSILASVIVFMFFKSLPVLPQKTNNNKKLPVYLIMSKMLFSSKIQNSRLLDTPTSTGKMMCGALALCICKRSRCMIDALRGNISHVALGRDAKRNNSPCIFKTSAALPSCLWATDSLPHREGWWPSEGGAAAEE